MSPGSMHACCLYIASWGGVLRRVGVGVVILKRDIMESHTGEVTSEQNPAKK